MLLAQCDKCGRFYDYGDFYSCYTCDMIFCYVCWDEADEEFKEMHTDERCMEEK